MTSSIAIVGMGVRFGGAPDLQRYWQLLVEGRDAFQEVPPDRFDPDSVLDANRRATDKSYTVTGSFVDDVRSFPGLAFGIPPRRLEVMDPQHRLALETALAAIEDSGRKPSELPRRTGVFVGISSTEWRTMVAARLMATTMASGAYGDVADPEAILHAAERLVPSRPYSAPGVLANMAAATVAQELDLHGPAYVVDAACASALVAVSDAVQQLRAGTLDAAVAGGVYAIVTPEGYIAFSRIGALSPRGKCTPFDAGADGFVLGDGGGMVVLKRLEDAQRDGDRVYAVIAGVATNNDGRGDGPMAPHPDGQAEVLRAAWEDAGLDPSRVGYVEAHGTGTDVGDPAEVKGLRRVIGDRTPAFLGSAKANVGHTMSAAGVAGLVRATLAVHHGVVPPMANFANGRPELADTAFRVPTRATPWDGERVASVSSFGFGGTNAAAILLPAPQPTPRLPLADGGRRTADAGGRPELVLMSAADDAALRDLCARTADAIEADPRVTLAGVARAWSARKPAPTRLGVVARDLPELVSKLRKVAVGETPDQSRTGVASAHPKVAFLFPGQGAQRVGMLASIRDRFPVVAKTVDEVERALDGVLDVPLTHLLWPERRPTAVSADEAKAALTDTKNQQPAMHAAGFALARLLDQVGVKPVVVTGHSLGEITAAAVAGVLDAGAAARFVARRGKAMADLPGDHGAMAAIMADADTVRALLVDGAVLANLNHPRQCVVSGATSAVEDVVRNAEAKALKAVRLDVSHAFHSPILEDLDVDALLADVVASDPKVTVASGIADRPYADAADAMGVFRRHATSPVDFVGALRQCQEAGADIYLQVGAGGPLAAFARGGLPKGSKVYTLAGQDDQDGGVSLLETLAQLWCDGVPVDVRPIAAESLVATLPPSVLAREVYWALKDEPQMLAKLGPKAQARLAAATSPSSASSAADRRQRDAGGHESAGDRRQRDAGGRESVADARQRDAGGHEGADEVLDKVLAVISRVSAYPKDALKPAMALQDDLGFDSLMVGDLATGLADAFPGLGGIPQEVLINRPTVGDIVAYARGGKSKAATVDDDAPLGAWHPVWRAASLPDRGRRPARPGTKVLVVGAVPEGLLAALSAEGAEALVADVPTALEVDAVDAIVATGLPVDDLLAIVARQDRAGARPDILTLSADEATAGAVRALSREWPDATCKNLRGDVDATTLVAEWRSADRTSDVRWDRGVRFVPGLERVRQGDVRFVPEGKTVLVTGGTRGIGAKLAARLVELGARALLVGRGEPDPVAQALVRDGKAVHLKVDVTDAEGLCSAVEAHRPVHAVVHAAGVLADGPVGAVDPARGKLARAVKAGGFGNAIAAAGEGLEVALAVGSWAGRFGNRHQSYYAAANAALAGLCDGARVRAVVAEFGPWTSSDMAKTIPAPVQQAMRAEGVDFTGDRAGLDALVADLQTAEGVVVHGRDLPPVSRVVRYEDVLDVATHPYLADHAVPAEGGAVPVLPLAGAADLLADVAGLEAPFEVVDLRLFQGVAVREALAIEASIRADRAELRMGERHVLAYRAKVRPRADGYDDPGALTGGETPPIPLSGFYGGVTFHGPLLQGIVAIDALGDGFVRGRVRTGRPTEWIPGSPRAAWAVDPLALDSAFQLAAYAAWVKYKRAGTPVSLGRYVQLRPFPAPGSVLAADVRFTSSEGDRFEADVTFRDADGRLLAVAEKVAAELRAVEGVEPEMVIKPEWVDPGQWQAIKDLESRLSMAEAVGIRNPYFSVHEGTARDTTVVGGRTLVNFSSYNYVGLSGDERVLDDVNAAIRRYGTSVSASRVASGQRPFHAELEALLAKCQGAEDSIVFTAGHATNVTTIGHLFGPKDLVFHDELIHDSALQGIKLSGATRRGFKHDDPADLEKQLRQIRKNFEKVLIVVEGVYSMDGDICDLPSYLRLKKKYGCWLMVDEAHSFGIVGKTGCGVGEHFGIDGREVDLWMGTLSKSLASCGGWIAGSHRIVNYLRYTAPGFVYSAGLTPANGQAALSSLKLMLAEPWRVEKLQSNARFFQKALVERGIDTGPAKGGSAVVPAVTGNSMHALLLSQRLNDQGINVQPIVYPAVADDAARLRFFLSSTHSEEQLAWTAEKVATTLEGIRKEFRL